MSAATAEICQFHGYRLDMVRRQLANSLVDAGQYEAALLESAEAKRLSPLQTLSDTFSAIALARLGRTDEVRAVLETMSATARDAYVPPTHFAMIETALGNRDKAFKHLDAALSVRDARLTLLKIDPKWDGLRSDPRFSGRPAPHGVLRPTDVSDS